jgi:FMN phosphatase YigB (HAD superfamily)
MRVSFDVDDTLVCGPEVPTEQFVPWWRRWWCPELLRRGTRDLMRALLARRCNLWIYTTSYRSPRHLRRWFRNFGVRLEGVVNQDVHDRVIKRSAYPFYPPSKYPPAFGIDLHIDDSEGVGIEGRRFNFRVLVVSPADPRWAERVLEAVDRGL